MPNKRPSIQNKTKRAKILEKFRSDFERGKFDTKLSDLIHINQEHGLYFKLVQRESQKYISADMHNIVSDLLSGKHPLIAFRYSLNRFIEIIRLEFEKNGTKLSEKTRQYIKKRYEVQFSQEIVNFSRSLARRINERIRKIKGYKPTEKEKELVFSLASEFKKRGVRVPSQEDINKEITGFFSNPAIPVTYKIASDPFNPHIRALIDLYKLTNSNATDSEIKKGLDKFTSKIGMVGNCNNETRKLTYGLNPFSQEREITIIHEFVHYLMDYAKMRHSGNEFITEYLSHLILAKTNPERYDEYSRSFYIDPILDYSNPLQNPYYIASGVNKYGSINPYDSAERAGRNFFLRNRTKLKEAADKEIELFFRINEIYYRNNGRLDMIAK